MRLKGSQMTACLSADSDNNRRDSTYSREELKQESAKQEEQAMIIANLEMELIALKGQYQNLIDCVDQPNELGSGGFQSCKLLDRFHSSAEWIQTRGRLFELERSNLVLKNQCTRLQGFESSVAIIRARCEEMQTREEDAIKKMLSLQAEKRSVDLQLAEANESIRKLEWLLKLSSQEKVDLQVQVEMTRVCLENPESSLPCSPHSTSLDVTSPYRVATTPSRRELGRVGEKPALK